MLGLRKLCAGMMGCQAPPQVFVVSTRKIQERGYETLYQFATASDRSLFGRVVLRCPKQLQVPLLCPASASAQRIPIQCTKEQAFHLISKNFAASLVSHSAASLRRTRADRSPAAARHLPCCVSANCQCPLHKRFRKCSRP